MWKESFRVGVEVIDNQHMKLFAKADELLKAVHDGGCAEHKEKCISTILFLKEYAVQHFADEEKYQLSINYKGYEEHKKMHEKFVKTVLMHEKNMKETDFAEKEIKQFAGMLVAWLLYHVADADQKIGKDKAAAEVPRNYSDLAFECICDVLNKIAGIDAKSVKKAGNHSETFADSVSIEVMLKGEVSGYIVITYPHAFVNKMMHLMMGTTSDSIDDLKISALYETTNIICGSICGKIAWSKGVVCDIEPPNITKRIANSSDERDSFDTGIGILETDIAIEYKK